MTDKPTYSLIPAESTENVRKLDALARTSLAEISAAEVAGDSLAKGLIAGTALSQMRGLLTDAVLATLMPLVGTPLGIRTDRDHDQRGYDSSVVRDVVLAGLMRGARVVGNEMNIIGGNLYLTKEYWERRFRELPGMESVRPPRCGIPKPVTISDKVYAMTQARVEYRYRGKVGKIECAGDDAIIVVWNKGQGIDAIHGKVKKRLYAFGVATITGAHVDVEDEPTPGHIETPWTDDQGPTSELELARRSCILRMQSVTLVDRLEHLKKRWDAFLARISTTGDASTDEIAAADADVDAEYREAVERLGN